MHGTRPRSRGRRESAGRPPVRSAGTAHQGLPGTNRTAINRLARHRARGPGGHPGPRSGGSARHRRRTRELLQARDQIGPRRNHRPRGRLTRQIRSYLADAEARPAKAPDRRLRWRSAGAVAGRGAEWPRMRGGCRSRRARSARAWNGPAAGRRAGVPDDGSGVSAEAPEWATREHGDGAGGRGCRGRMSCPGRMAGARAGWNRSPSGSGGLEADEPGCRSPEQRRRSAGWTERLPGGAAARWLPDAARLTAASWAAGVGGGAHRGDYRRGGAGIGGARGASAAGAASELRLGFMRRARSRPEPRLRFARDCVQLSASLASPVLGIEQSSRRARFCPRPLPPPRAPPHQSATIVVDRAGVGFLLGDAQFGQVVQGSRWA